MKYTYDEIILHWSCINAAGRIILCKLSKRSLIVSQGVVILRFLVGGDFMTYDIIYSFSLGLGAATGIY